MGQRQTKYIVQENKIGLHDIIKILNASGKICQITNVTRLSNIYNLVNKKEICELIKKNKYNIGHMDRHLIVLSFYTDLLRDLESINCPAIGICSGNFKNIKILNYMMCFFVDVNYNLYLIDVFTKEIYDFDRALNLFNIII